MRYGSVCSGIEAASVAWEPMGWECAFVSEIDRFPSAVLAHRYPGVPNLGDFTTIEGSAGPVDVLVGGTPCQGFSVAGLRGGLADERSNLALGFLRLIDRLRPKWVVWENVPGVRSVNGGRDFGAFLGGLGQLGYGWAYRSLDAQYFGLAQRRERVFVVGHLGDDWRPSVAVLFERQSMSGHPAPVREAGSVVAGTLEARSATGGYDPGAHGAASGHLITNALAERQGRLDINAETFVSCTLPASDGGVSSGYHPVIPFDTTQITSKLNRSHPKAGDPCHPLASGAHPPAIAFQERGRDGGRNLEYQKDLSYALKAVDGGGCGDWMRINHGLTVRRLTPLECERLQGFPDNWTLVPYRGKPAADGPRYKAIGNSMPVPVMRWIGRRIEMVCRKFS